MDERIPGSDEAFGAQASAAAVRPVRDSLALRHAGLAALLVACAVPACVSRPVISVPRVGPSASEAMSTAHACVRKSVPVDREQARELALHALELEPDWVAPQRLLDDLMRDDLRGVEALQEHRSRLARMDEGASAKHLAGELYLAGRLEGVDGRERFERALRIDPDLAWGYHGLSWAAGVGGESRAAVIHAREALARSRDSWERSFFTAALARTLVTANKREEASKLLEERAVAADTRLFDRDSLELQAVEIGLEAGTLRARIKSYERALVLLRERDLAEGEIDALVSRLRLAPSPDDPDSLALQSSLAVRRSPVRDRLRAEIMLDSAPTPLALALLQHGLAAENRVVPAGALMRAARFAAGEYGAAIELWLAELPKCVLGPDGRPADARMKHVVECARRLDRGAGATPDERSAALADLGEALVAAGWFREARSVAGDLAGQDLERALSIESRAVAGQELIESVRRLVRKVDLERGSTAPATSADVDTYRIVKDADSGLRLELLGERTGVKDLESLLDALAPSFARAHAFLGGDGDSAHVTRELSHSPLMSYGPIGELVHPGPRFSAQDEAERLGRAGASVPGLASELDRIGRFGLFGEVAGGGGPDGTMLPRIHVEEKSGNHLGVPWSGTIAWCESAELKSRAGRRGAHISAAALHEGYWVDIDAVRGELAVWNALRREFAGSTADRDSTPPGRTPPVPTDIPVLPTELPVPSPDHPTTPGAQSLTLGDPPRGSGERHVSPSERITRVLAVRGLALEAGDPERRSRERTRSGFLLGEAQRVRLALLVERGAQAKRVAASGDVVLGEVSLDELVAVTSTHEEGHLCDRTRYLPLSSHLGAVFLFLLDCGFSPRKVTEMLEYRAQLTSLCDSPDPRVPLAQVLDAAEQGPSGITPHASGYALLLSDFLDVFDAELTRRPQAFPRIDPNFTLAHQLHNLSAEDVRGLARSLAHKKRLSR